MCLVFDRPFEVRRIIRILTLLLLPGDLVISMSGSSVISRTGTARFSIGLPLIAAGEREGEFVHAQVMAT
jgi:hypothetical protein